MKSNRVTFAGRVRGSNWVNLSPFSSPHPLTKRHTTAPLSQVVAAGIFFAGSVTGIFFAEGVTGAGVVAAGIFFFFVFVCFCLSLFLFLSQLQASIISVWPRHKINVCNRDNQ